MNLLKIYVLSMDLHLVKHKIYLKYGGWFLLST